MKNTVTIDLVEYNDLRDFKKAIKEGKKLVVTRRKKSHFDETILVEEEIYTDCEITQIYIEEIKKLQGFIKEKDNQIFILNKKESELQAKEIQKRYEEPSKNWFQRMFYRQKDVIFSPEKFKFDIEKIK